MLNVYNKVHYCFTVNFPDSLAERIELLKLLPRPEERDDPLDLSEVGGELDHDLVRPHVYPQQPPQQLVPVHELEQTLNKQYMRTTDRSLILYRYSM